MKIFQNLAKWLALVLSVLSLELFYQSFSVVPVFENYNHATNWKGPFFILSI